MRWVFEHYWPVLLAFVVGGASGGVVGYLSVWDNDKLIATGLVLDIFGILLGGIPNLRPIPWLKPSLRSGNAGDSWEDGPDMAMVRGGIGLLVVGFAWQIFGQLS